MRAITYCLIGGGPCLSQTEWAAWVQAIGSILAVAVAIAVPFWLALRDRRERARSHEGAARSLALVLLGDIRTVGEALNDVWGNDCDNDGIIRPPASSVPAALVLPPRLAANADRLHDLGSSAEPTQRLVYLLGRAQELWAGLDGQAWSAGQAEGISAVLWDATGAVADALNAIDAMFQNDWASGEASAVIRAQAVEAQAG